MKTLTFLLIHLVTPVAGMTVYFLLRKKILKESIENPPLVDLFVIFGLYIGVLWIILTGLFWRWTAMASLGAFFLTVPGFVTMAIIIYRNYKLRHKSIYHKMSYLSGLTYCIMIPLSILIANVVEHI